MINKSCKPGRKACAARRLAGILLTTTMAGTLAAGAPAPMYAATWQENADYIFSVLTQKMGYTEAAACGIMANIRCESTFNPHAWNAGGGSYGLCQWTGGRYGRLQNWCRSNGYDYTTIDGQLAYLQYELQNHYPGVENYIRSVENTSDGAYKAGQYYCYHFEAPASRGSVSVYRGGLASGTYWESYRPAEWYLVDGIWHYILRDGSYQTQWLTLEDKTYYFDEDGKRIVGWKNIEGKRYYFDNDGVMASGWQKIDGRSYYFGNDGSLVTGIVRSGDEWFLLDDTGAVQASSAMEEFAPVWVASAKEEMDVQESDSKDAALLADAEKGSSSSSETEEAGLSPVTSPAEDRREAATLADAGITAPSLTEDKNASALSVPDSINENTKGSGSLFDVLEQASVKASALLAGTAETLSGEALASSQASPGPEQQEVTEDKLEEGSLQALIGPGQQAISEDDNAEDLSDDYSLAARAMQDAANTLNEDTEEEESPAPGWMSDLPITFSEVTSPDLNGSLPAAGIQFNSDDLVAAADNIQDINDTASANPATDSEDGKDGETEKKDLTDKNETETETETGENSALENPDTVNEDSESEKPDDVTGNSVSDKSDKLADNSTSENQDGVTGNSVSDKAVVAAGENTGDSETENPDEITDDSETENPGETTDDSESEKPDDVTDDSESETPGETTDDSETENPDEITDDSESEKPDDVTDDSESEKPDEIANDSESEKPDDVTDDSESEKPDDVTDDSESEKPDDVTDDSESEKPDDVTDDSESETPDEITDDSDSENPEEDKTDSDSEKPGEDSQDTSEDSETAGDAADTSDTSSEPEEETASVSEKENTKILISLTEDIPDIHRNEMDSLVDILRKKKILSAVTSTGLDITREVTAAFTPSDTEDGLYTVTFQVEFAGDSAETTSSVYIIED